jgi:DNA mismatch repair protein MutS2
MLIFPKTSLLTTEFDKIRETVMAFCISAMGKEKLQAVAPLLDYNGIVSELSRTAEAYRVVSAALPFPTTGYTDAGKETTYLRIENSVLTEEQLVAIRRMAETVMEIHGFFKNRPGQFPHLETIAAHAPPEKQITASINTVLDENGVVLTSASPDLARIRRSLQRSRAEADRIYNSVISKYRKNGWITESEESSRNGRRVIAVFAEQKRTARGIVHDLSATGKTAFLEPEEAMGINQVINTLEFEEKQEILRILRELSRNLRKYVPLLTAYRSMLGTIDLLLAKALFATRADARFPKIVSVPVLHLRQARHPLLYLHNKSQHKATIPFDLKLGDDTRILVISGPNAGGKTVCMKTAGLLQMMVQSGFPVTAHEDSEFGVFENLLVDIGDSQSIEYELSTYSSRLKHMKTFLEKVNQRSLFLIDEFGTGTDPNLGGALAEAVLEELNKKKSIGIITTHYLNLKVMADRTEGIINGSMEFDLKRLRPLYRLHIGKPGSSYTFLVAERSGLPREVIKSARRKVSRKNLMLEKLLTDVEQEKDQLKVKSAAAEARDKQLKTLLQSSEEKKRHTEISLQQQELKLKKLEERLIREGEERFKNFMKEWKKAKDKKVVVDKYYRQFVQKKKTEDPKAIAKKRAEKIAAIKSLLKKGTLVRLENSKTTGVVEKIDHETVFVIFGGFRTQCEMDKLEVVI